MPSSTINQNNPRHIAIIGGGISGLATAWYLQSGIQQLGIDAQIHLYEQSTRLGGKITTHQIHHDNADFVIEAGPDSMLLSKPWAWQLAQELGIAQQQIGTNLQQRTLYIWKDERLQRVPAGIQLIVPTSIAPIIKSELFSWWGKLRFLTERFVPKRTSNADESLFDFLTRRYGAEIRDTLGIPLMEGIYNADAKHQSMHATFSQYVQSEQQNGSLAASKKPTLTKKPAPKSLFFTFPQGTQYLVDTLVAQLTNVTIHTNHTIAEITHTGAQFEIKGTPVSTTFADIVVLSTSAYQTAPLVAGSAPLLANHLSTQLYVSTGTISLIYPHDAIPMTLDGYGVLFAHNHKRYFNAITISSQKFRQRAPDSHMIIRMFFGGHTQQDVTILSDEQITALATAELHRVLNITVPPQFTQVFHWPYGTPQYTINHHEWVASSASHTPPHMYLTGSSYHGIGIPDCIHHAQQTAQQIIRTLQQG
jgi:oxygen-dependent protoporphyrinogen oxidase